jgi:hypothetical protein
LKGTRVQGFQVSKGIGLGVPGIERNGVQGFQVLKGNRVRLSRC